MKKIFAMLILALALVSCGPRGSKATSSDVDTTCVECVDSAAVEVATDTVVVAE